MFLINENTKPRNDIRICEDGYVCLKNGKGFDSNQLGAEFMTAWFYGFIELKRNKKIDEDMIFYDYLKEGLKKSADKDALFHFSNKLMINIAANIEILNLLPEKGWSLISMFWEIKQEEINVEPIAESFFGFWEYDKKRELIPDEVWIFYYKIVLISVRNKLAKGISDFIDLFLPNLFELVDQCENAQSFIHLRDRIMENETIEIVDDEIESKEESALILIDLEREDNKFIKYTLYSIDGKAKICSTEVDAEIIRYIPYFSKDMWDIIIKLVALHDKDPQQYSRIVDLIEKSMEIYFIEEEKMELVFSNQNSEKD